MARITRSQLHRRLSKAEAPFFRGTLDKGKGSVIIAARGARVLGLYPGFGTDALSALWTNEHIDDVLSGAARDWEGAGMGSSGGERLWVGPERSFYYRQPETFEGWFCQPAMDPGEYTATFDSDGRYVCENVFDLEDIRAGRTYHGVTLRREFLTINEPFKDNEALEAVFARLNYAGIRKTDSILLPDAPADAQVNLWTLALVDPGPPGSVGTAVVPVKSGADPIDYFGGLTPVRLVQRPDHVAFRIDAVAIAKLGIRPEDIDLERGARIAAFLPTADPNRLFLVLQSSFDVPRSQDECLDEAKANPDGPKGVVQSYNNGPGADLKARYARFGEIEIQLAAASPVPDGKGLAATVESDMLAFEGARKDILELGREVLDISEIHLF